MAPATMPEERGSPAPNGRSPRPHIDIDIDEGTIAQASRADAAEIENLRLSCYRAAREFELLQPAALAWDAADDANTVLIARSNSGQLLSTTRGSLVADAQTAEQAMGCSNELPDAVFPSLLLGRGATLHAKGGAGLHSLLRYHFLLAASGSTVQSLIGMVYAGAPRTRLMAGIGYEFFQPNQVWDPEVRAHSPNLIAVLERDRFAAALNQLEATLGDLLGRFPLHGAAVRLDGLGRSPVAVRGGNG
ncbi:hypothetical protein ACFOLJ_22305 [Rugamonas sp. CCM 8940]|nr:hypothetical protein [Rugamonas sp. CCM 8940]MBJ7311456.1 hypothetical protein [Rugamonas sp. CCM 8940]